MTKILFLREKCNLTAILEMLLVLYKWHRTRPVYPPSQSTFIKTCVYVLDSPGMQQMSLPVPFSVDMNFPNITKELQHVFLMIECSISKENCQNFASKTGVPVINSKKRPNFFLLFSFLCSISAFQ